MTVLHWIVGILLLISALVMIVTVLLQSSERSGLGAISGAAETFFVKNKAKGMDAKLALITLSLLQVWQFGSAMVIFLAALKGIPAELYEAASIDGAGRMRILWTILVPSIKPAVVVVGMMLFIQIWNDLLQQIIYIKFMYIYINFYII